jgi:hypothetical protein
VTTSNRISIRVDKTQKEALEKLAESLNLTSSELIRKLIDNLLEFTKLSESLSLEKIFSTNPLLTIGEFLSLPDQGKETWDSWFKEEVNDTLAEDSERDISDQ